MTRQSPWHWLAAAAGVLAIWHLLVVLTGVPHWILPSPLAVAETLVSRAGLLARHFWVTAAEMLAGMLLGTLLGAGTALVSAHFATARRWLLPVLVASQAVPVFALAPLLVLWFGYGMASKVAMATLIIFFPVSSAFLDGLRRTDPGWIALAHSMTAALPERRARRAVLVRVRIPAALPALASGLRVAMAVAPIGAVVGEWVGSSAGLGYLMLHANGRMQVDLMFAALLVLAVFSVLAWFTLDAALRRWLPWQPDALPLTR